MDRNVSILVGLFLSLIFLLNLFISKKIGAFVRAWIYTFSIVLPSICNGVFVSKVVY